MNEERKLILQMLKDGTISVEEAERLMDAIPEEAKKPARSMAGGAEPKKISILVTEDGRQMVNLSIPFSLVKSGLKLGKAAGALGLRNAKNEEEAAVFESIQEIDVDQILASLRDGEISLPHAIVDMDDGKKLVKIVLE